MEHMISALSNQQVFDALAAGKIRKHRAGMAGRFK